jgi:hypothetical protein
MSVLRSPLRFAPWLRAALAAALLAACAEPEVSTRAATAPSLAAARVPDAPVGELVEVVYDGGLRPGWEDYGWTPRELGKGPASARHGAYGGWIIAHPGLSGRYGALVFQVSRARRLRRFPRAARRLRQAQTCSRRSSCARAPPPLAEGWVQVVLPLRELDPRRATPSIASCSAPRRPSARSVCSSTRSASPRRARASVPRTPPTDEVALSIDCRGPSPAGEPAHLRDRLRSAARREGAAPVRAGGDGAALGRQPRVPLQLGARRGVEHRERLVLRERRLHGRRGLHLRRVPPGRSRARPGRRALTVPILGWVAKDTTSYAFPVSEHGPSARWIPTNRTPATAWAATAKPLALRPSPRTSVALLARVDPPLGRAIRAEDQQRGARSVALYILDNEPMLWNSTHRDVHPEPVTYDELLDRTLRYGSAVRAADPDAVIAGPAEWGWPALFLLGQGRRGGLPPEARSPRPRRRPAARLVPAEAPRPRAEDGRPPPRRGRRTLLSAGRRRRRQRGGTDSAHSGAAHPLDARALGSDVHRRVVDQGPRGAHPPPAEADRRELPGPRRDDRRVQLRRRGAHERRPRAGRGPRPLRPGRRPRGLLLDLSARSLPRLLGLSRVPQLRRCGRALPRSLPAHGCADGVSLFASRDARGQPPRRGRS